MGFFEKFKKPNNETLKKGAALGAAAGIMTGGGDVLAQQHNSTNQGLNPNKINEYTKKEPQPTIEASAKRVGININPESLPNNTTVPQGEVDETIDAIQEEGLSPGNTAPYSERIVPQETIDEDIHRIQTGESSLYRSAIDEAIIKQKQIDSESQTPEGWTPPVDNKEDNLEKMSSNSYEVTDQNGKHTVKASPDTPPFKWSNTDSIDNIPSTTPTDEPWINPDTGEEYVPKKSSDSGENPSTENSTDAISTPEKMQESAEKAIQLLKKLLDKAPNIFKGKNLVALTTLTASALAYNTDSNAQNLEQVYNNLTLDTSYTQKTSTETMHESNTRQAYLDYVKYPESHHFEEITPEGFLNLPENKGKYQGVTVDDINQLTQKINNGTPQKNFSLKSVKHPAGKFMDALPTVKARPGKIIRPIAPLSMSKSNRLSKTNDMDPRSNVYIDKKSGVNPLQVIADPTSEVNIGGFQNE